ncbi:peptide chain release factor N(5)-glutamine methyltransferase [Granulicella arctica]|uniref:peptide chain release factor N(5)-glutamine methyltransferase n=1 Tax=Granulicella arctica TaxID=940613 RepID=UPI0021E07C21|nr:peptide chain release factor N(5)-glutamine methyltransferase [Granulicella arctica]
MRLRDALAAARERLETHADLATSAGRDAELLLLHAAGLPRASLFAYPECELGVEEDVRYQASVARRLALEPIQYIIGVQEFYGLALKVTPAVLIPRPETEHLIEAVLERSSKDEPLRILDVGTGSGAIAIALATHLPKAQVTALDLSPGALAVAEENVRAHGLAGRIRFIGSDLLAAVAGEIFDVIVSNPPYIPAADRSSLHPQVREYEPDMALFAGAAGMDIYRRLVPQAFDALRPGGLLAMEIGWGQTDAIRDLLSGWMDVSFVDDLQGIPRVALARRPD